MFTQVNNALNAIDRRLYPPVETLDERRDQLIDEYKRVREQFADMATACGLADWLRHIIASRIFTTIIYDETQLHAARALFQEMEQTGYPMVTNLISIRMIWANALKEAKHEMEGRSVARRLVEDIKVIREIYPHYFRVDFDGELADFCARHGID